MNRFNGSFLGMRMKKILIGLSCLVVAGSALAQDRIISASSGVTDLLIALNKQDAIVAVDVTSRGPAVAKLPVVGYHRQLSAEGLLSIAPSMLIGSKEMGPKSTLTVLEQAGVDVVVLPTESTPNSLIKRINILGEKLDRPAEAKVLVEKVNTIVADLDSNNAKVETPKSVLFLLVNEKGTYTAAGGNTTAHTVVELAGGVNPGVELNSYQALSAEAFLEMQPDAIVVSGRQWRKYQDINALIDYMPLLADTPAGKNNEIYVINGSYLIGGLGMGSLIESQQLQKKLYSVN